VELGYNLQLQKKEDDAKIYYDQGLDTQEKPKWSLRYRQFIRKVLLDYALKSYQIASDLEPIILIIKRLTLWSIRNGNDDFHFSGWIVC
jgi:hypothetical protein